VAIKAGIAPNSIGNNVGGDSEAGDGMPPTPTPKAKAIPKRKSRAVDENGKPVKKPRIKKAKAEPKSESDGEDEAAAAVKNEDNSLKNDD
jgi:hypothetical protein